MKIFGHFFSAPANQVRLTASAIGHDFEYIHVDLTTGEQKTEEYLAINPVGKVPALDDDGFKLSESNAISRYLACKTDCALYPNDAKARAVIDQWMDYSAHHVRANMAKILFNKMFAPLLGQEPDEKSMAEGRDLLDQNLAPVNSTLGEHAFLTGGALTIADTAMLAAMEPFDVIEYDYAKFGHIKRWRDQLMATDWYQRVHERYAAEAQ